MSDPRLYSLLADAILVLHFAFVVFVLLGKLLTSPGRRDWLYRNVCRALAAQDSVLSGRTVDFHDHLYLFRCAGSARLVPRQT